MLLRVKHRPRAFTRPRKPEPGPFRCWDRKRRWMRVGRLSLASHILRALVFAQANKARMTKVIVTGPLHELELPDELRLYPAALDHLRSSESGTPSPGLFLR